MHRCRSTLFASLLGLSAGCFSDGGASLSSGSTTGSSTGAVTTTGAASTGEPVTTSATTTSTGPDMPGMCGDGLVEAPEECDMGADNGAGEKCTPACTINVCGDGYAYIPIEGCDDGNTMDGDGCNAMCVGETCGDGFKDAGEECDDGNTVASDGCGPTCQIELCGDGVIQRGEECDDGNGVDGDACGATCLSSGCGDGVKQGGEECDDGNADAFDGCDACQRKFLRVFALSMGVTGNMGGLAGADALCDMEAGEANLSGTYRAWLATSESDVPSIRFKHLPVPYLLPDGVTVVSQEFADFLDGDIEHAIDQDAAGMQFPADVGNCEAVPLAWTGIDPDGMSTPQHCEGWTSDDNARQGAAGFVGSTAAQWTYACLPTCDWQLQLYCFEQAD